MFQPAFFYMALNFFLIGAFFVLFLLLSGKFTAPYGKMTSSAWGSTMIPAKLGWLIMESPASIIFIILLLISKDSLNSGTIVLFIVWQIHYFYRSFIYPIFTKHKNPMPIALFMSSFIFQLINTYFQAGLIFIVAPENYAGDYLNSVHFYAGLFIFLVGTIINRYSDHILQNLRKPGETEYKIPYGFMYKFVSCPNYLGEIIIWIGWAIMLKSTVGLAFFMWTLANLLPRALTTHKWYLQKFPDYPKERKALIPFIL